MRVRTGPLTKLFVWLRWFRFLLCRIRGVVCTALVNEFFVVVGVVGAYEFLDVPGGTQLEVSVPRPSFRIRLGVIDRNVNLQGVGGRPPNALGYVELVRMRKTSAIDPSLVVKTNRVEDE